MNLPRAFFILAYSYAFIFVNLACAMLYLVTLPLTLSFEDSFQAAFEDTSVVDLWDFKKVKKHFLSL